MKVTRSYWLGLGSGLILSAMLALILSPNQGRVATQIEPSTAPTIQQPAATQSPAETPKQAVPPVSTPPSASIQQNFSIPKGASSEQIADLLIAQGFIKDRGPFLSVAHQMGVESQFRTGTFTLVKGLTTEEVIQRLLK
ncbi:MAG TPA: ABC transporter substrate-binding protein [Desulfosporosinus sp.]